MDIDAAHYSLGRFEQRYPRRRYVAADAGEQIRLWTLPTWRKSKATLWRASENCKPVLLWWERSGTITCLEASNSWCGLWVAAQRRFVHCVASASLAPRIPELPT